MNYHSQFDQIVNFLKPIKNLWAMEVLDFFPDNLDVYNQEWILFLDDLDDKILWKVDCHSDYNLVKNSSFGLHMKEISKLCELESLAYELEDNLPSWAFQKVKEKKRHEILALSNIIKKIKKENDFTHLVDIGGGVGHLSRILAHYHSIECISLDIDEKFQEIGAKRLNKYPIPKNAKSVKFINHDFSKDLSSDLNRKIFNEGAFSLGLHTCGPLANHHLNAMIKNSTKGFINFGCCYNRLDTHKDLNLSQHAKECGLDLSEYSLTLATRGHSSMDYDGFKLKRRVKCFRYALQYYLYKYEGIKTLQAVGESHARVYWGDFGLYAHEKLTKIGFKSKLSLSELDQFYNESKNQELFNKMFICDIIRWQLGRPLELYILLDRLIHGLEQGISCELKQVFDKNISPRNIAIISKK